MGSLLPTWWPLVRVLLAGVLIGFLSGSVGLAILLLGESQAISDVESSP